MLALLLYMYLCFSGVHAAVSISWCYDALAASFVRHEIRSN